ncbi:DolP-mannose mannosyltransferase [Halobacteriaceae archaeon GCM10025711]
MLHPRLRAAAISVWLYGRTFASGIFAALSAGFWQFGVLFPILVVGLTVKHRRSELMNVVGGGAVVAVVAVAPIVALGGGRAMVQQVVLAPIVTGHQGNPISLSRRAIELLWLAAPLVILSGYTAIAATQKSTLLPSWWVGVGLGWFLLQILVFDLDGAPDLILLLAFAALSLGVYVGRASSYEAVAVVGVLVVTTVLLTMPWIQHGFPLNPTVVPPAAEYVDTTLFWNGEFPDSCHIRNSAMERQWLTKTSLSAGCS